MNRYANFDLLRILCTVMVVLIHVNAYFFADKLTMVDCPKDVVYYFENFFNVITRVSIPCFVMMSGAFCLNGKRIREYKTFIGHAFYKVFLPFFFVYLIWMLLLGGKTFLVTHNYRFLFYTAINMPGTLWFVPMILGCYIVSPFFLVLRDKLLGDKVLKLAGGETVREGGGITYRKIVFLFLLWAIVSGVVTTTQLPYSIHVIFTYLPFFLVGDVLFNSDKRISSTLLIASIVCFLTITFFFRVCVSQFYALEPFPAFLSPTVITMSICTFLLFKQIVVNNNKRQRFYEKIGGYTYLVYLVHALVIRFIGPVIKQIDINEVIKIVLMTILVTVISFFVAMIWAKIRTIINEKYCIEQHVLTVFERIKI